MTPNPGPGRPPLRTPRDPAGSSPTSGQRRAGLAIAALGIVAIAAATLTPLPGITQSLPFLCLLCGDYGLVDFTLNVLLFVPLGFGLRLAGVRARTVVALAVAATFLIELLQLRLVAGRDSALGDLVANSIGGALGALLASWLPGLLRPGRRLAAGLTAGWMLASVAVIGVTVLALRPIDSGYYQWYAVQWSPDYAPFSGEVLGLRLNGRRLPRFDVSDPVLTRSTAERPFLVEALVRASPPSGGQEVVVRWVNEGSEGFRMLRIGDELRFRMRIGAARLRLRSPEMALPGAFAGVGADDTLLLSGGSDGASMRVARATAGGRGGARTERRLDFSPGLGWALVEPFGRPIGRDHHLLSALWLAGLLLPLGYWRAWADAGRPLGAWSLAAAALVVGALGVLPPSVGWRAAHGGEWAGSGAALLLGAMLARRLGSGRGEGA